MRRNTRSFPHCRSFFKSDGIDRLVPASNREQTPLPRAYSFIAEAFSDLKVSVGLCPRAYSFIAEAFSNLKVSTGLCLPAYSFISEAFSNLKVLAGLCPPAYMVLFVKSPPLCPTHNGKIMRPDPLAQDPGRKRKEKKGLLERLFGWL